MLSGVVESPALSRRSLRLALLPGLLLLALCAPAGASASWITDGPEAETAMTSATFMFEAPGASSYTCSLDGVEESCTSPHEYADVAEGFHWFELEAFDAAGARLADPDIAYWYVDLTPPETTITSALQAVTGPAGSFAFAADEEDARFECSVDGWPFAGCRSPWRFSVLADGPHTFAVRALDTAGNPDGSPATRIWTVDATPPPVNLVSFSASAAARTATLTFTSPEAGVTFTCDLTGRPAVPCTSPYTWRDLPAGPLRFTVHARDTFGNVGHAFRRWTLDLLNLDGDPYRAPQDCRDDDPAINPAARDLLADGIDQNCDGFDGPRPVRGSIVARWRVGRRTTGVVRLRVTGLYKGARVRISCRGRGCPIGRRRRKPTLPSDPRQFGTVDLRALLRGRSLPAGSTLTIQVTQRNMTTKLAVFRIRKGRPPAGGELRCLPAGAATPVACPASSY